MVSRSEENRAGNWYSIQAAAEIWGVHPNTVRNRIRTDQVRARQVEISGRLVYEVEILDDDAALAESQRSRDLDVERIAELQVQVGRLEAERDQVKAENAQLRRATEKLEGQVNTLGEELVTALAINKAIEEEREKARNRHEKLAIEHGSLVTDHVNLQVRRDSLASEHRQALGILFAAKRYYLGAGVLPWLRRRFGRFSRFEELTPNRTLSLPHPLDPDDEKLGVRNSLGE